MKHPPAFRLSRRPRAIVVAILLAIFGVGACSAPPPYIHRPDEFNRAAVNFSKEPTDADDVIVCYGRSGTTAAQVIAVARAECARFGKIPQFDRQSILTCPLFTPVSAHYNCIVGPAAK
jgi:hypothetical protein